MKTLRLKYLQIIFIAILVLVGSCSKSGSGDTSSLYVPTSADVTVNATLQELTQGRALYISNCNACHGLYNPDSYTPSQWRSILNNMTPKTALSVSEGQLVTKYLTRGN